MELDYDQDYYRRREAHARDLAARSLNPAVSRIHSELADGYADLARKSDPPSLRLVARQ